MGTKEGKLLVRFIRRSSLNKHFSDQELSNVGHDAELNRSIVINSHYVIIIPKNFRTSRKSNSTSSKPGTSVGLVLETMSIGEMLDYIVDRDTEYEQNKINFKTKRYKDA